MGAKPAGLVHEFSRQFTCFTFQAGSLARRSRCAVALCVCVCIPAGLVPKPKPKPAGLVRAPRLEGRGN